MDFGIGSLGIRFAEVVFVLNIVRLFVKPGIGFVGDRLLVRPALLILVLLLSSSLWSIGLAAESHYRLSYLLRGFAYVAVGYAFVRIPFGRQSARLIRILPLYIVSVQCVFALLTVAHIHFAEFIVRGKMATFLPTGLGRFSGTASEPGYIVSTLAIPLWYFAKSPRSIRTTLLWLFTVVLTASTGSPFALAVLAFVMIGTPRGRKTILAGSIVFLVAYALSPAVRQIAGTLWKGLLLFGFEKAKAYLSLGGTDFSSLQRSGTVKLALDYYSTLPLPKVLFGAGTGGFALYSLDNAARYGLQPAFDANNLLVATLIDHGVLGLLVLLAFFLVVVFGRWWTFDSYTSQVRRLVVPRANISVTALHFALVVKTAQWMYDGYFWRTNFWLVFWLWMSVRLTYVQQQRRSVQRNTKQETEFNGSEESD